MNFINSVFQALGAPHIHYKLWIEGAPIYGTSPDNEVIDYIDKHITCRMPDPIKEPELYRLVQLYQIHHCTGSCKRKLKKRGAITEICRYGFPRATASKTTLNPINETLKSRRNGKSPRKIYNLKRN